MTRLDAALQRSDSHALIEMQSRRGSTSTSRRESVSKQQTENRREIEQNGSRAIFQRANRFLSQDRDDGSQSAPVRYFERGHPLPANHSPERKAIIPFRNPDLGLPSYRRRSDYLHNEAMSGLSPQRHMTYSNFRRSDSQSRASPRSGSPRSTNASPQRQAESRSSSHRRSSATHGHRTSHTSSRQASGKCTPSHRRGSVVSVSSGTNKYADSFSPVHKRSPSQSSYGHSLDSEKLYKNLKSIASSAESDASEDINGWSKGINSDVEIDGDYKERNHGSRHSGRNSRKSGHNTGYNSREFSPTGGYCENNKTSHIGRKSGRNSRSSRNSGSNTGYNTPGTSTPYREHNNPGHFTPKKSIHNADRNGAYSDVSDKQSRSGSCQSQSSNHTPISPTSPASTPNISQSRRGQYQVAPSDFTKSQTLSAETNKPATDRSRSNIRRGLEALILSENTRSSSQPPVPEMTIEDYVIIADIPRTKLYPEEEEPIIVRRRPQSQSPRRDNQHSSVDGRYEHEGSEERGRGRERERGRDRKEKERRRLEKEIDEASKTSSTASGYSQRSSDMYEDNSRALNSAHRGPVHPQMQGWMFMLDEDEEWRKYWFVITDSGLRYYRDAEALKRDESDGEIYLHHCLGVEEFDADKDYGLQLHMRDGLVTLSAMTSRIRRNWINVLRSQISYGDSAESIHDNSDSSDNSGFLNASSQNPTASQHQHNQGSDNAGPYQGEPDMTSSPLSNRREAGEGRDKDQERRLEDRTKWFQEGVSDREGEDPWERVELKKGALAPAVLTHPQVDDLQTGPDIERKWADFEQLPFGELRTLSSGGSQTPEATNEILQREVLSLRKQIDALRQRRAAAGVAGLCGPDAPCSLRLEQIEREHRERLQEMERDKQRLLQEEAHNTVQAMEALRKSHQEEIEKLRRYGGEEPTDPSIRKQLRESISLQREVDGLSERYSQQCMELIHSAEDREGEIRKKEREMEELRGENQELQARLTEEISLMRSFITGQRSGVVPLGSYERSTSELEMLLKVKENEVEYLHNEISCLKKEVQALTMENKALSERYKEVHVELSELKGNSEREINALKEHLKLTSTALDEGHLHGNSANQ
nr:TRIO and F-actin-binding protein isoform X2 [Misgurnus anguillicaudatus]